MQHTLSKLINENDQLITKIEQMESDFRTMINRLRAENIELHYQCRELQQKIYELKCKSDCKMNFIKTIMCKIEEYFLKRAEK